MAEIKNLKKVAERIKKAAKSTENIILYGDTDLDGVTSVVILKETIKTLSGKAVTVYFPDREKEGYGINKSALQNLKEKIPALLIALDCGISNFKEVLLAKKMGFTVLIIDHHKVIDKLPAADIIVDPKQKDDPYPFKGLATAGIVFKLSKILLDKNFSDSLKKSLLELVALATLADLMPKEADNQIFIEEGLSFLKNTWRPGLKSFLNVDFFADISDFDRKVAKIISILNVRDVQDNLPASFRLLTSSSLEDSEELIRKLIEKNQIRKQKIEEIVLAIEARQENNSIIFKGDPKFELSFISSVASILCHRYKKPVFIYKKLEKESQGTVRTPKGIDSVSLMQKCAKCLMSFGGHPQASGFRLKNENLEKFEECLMKNLKKN